MYLFIHLFLERRRERERERERNINVWWPLAHPLLGTWHKTQTGALDWKLNQRPFGVCRSVLNPLSHTSPGL